MIWVNAMVELIEELRAGYLDDPAEAARELARLDDLCNKAADELQKREELRVIPLPEGYIEPEKDPYTVLSKINVNDHTENKNGLTYLSWAWAWDILMSIYPDSYTTINRPAGGLPYWTDGSTCWVDVGVTIVWNGFRRERSEIFPIMDYRNRSIPLEKITSFDLNTALQRAWTKCIARHGLGFYIYAGQDLPNEEYQAKKQAEEEAKKELATADDIEKIRALYYESEIEKMLKRLKLKDITELNAEQAAKMIAKRDNSLITAEVESF